MNSIDSNIQLIYETDNNGSRPFLETLVTRTMVSLRPSITKVLQFV